MWAPSVLHNLINYMSSNDKNKGKKQNEETLQYYKTIHTYNLFLPVVCSFAKCSLEHIKRRVDFLWQPRQTAEKNEREREKKWLQLWKSAHTKSIKEIYLSFNMSSADYLTMKWKSEQLLKWNPVDFFLSILCYVCMCVCRLVARELKRARSGWLKSRFQN